VLILIQRLEDALYDGIGIRHGGSV
jgi:hypothetical protein